jgi:hypothetical protein
MTESTQPELLQTAIESPPPVESAKPASSFQGDASRQGRQFAEQCELLLKASGFEPHGRRLLPEIGIEIDCEAVAPSGALVWFEYKGSVQGSRPGLMRTDTLKKAIANGALVQALEDHPPFVVLTSHLPDAGSGLTMLQRALERGFFADAICLYDPKQTARLKAL